MGRHMAAEDRAVYRVVVETAYPDDHPVWAGRLFTATLGPFCDLRAARGVASREKRAHRHSSHPPTITTEIQRARLDWEPLA